MQIIKSILFLSSILLLLASCTGDKTSSTKGSAATANLDHSAVASELCVCMQPLIDLNKQIQSLVKQGKTDEVQALIGEVEKLSDEGEACTERLEAKYGKISGDNEVEVEAAMMKACPEVAQMISRANRQEN